MITKHPLSNKELLRCPLCKKERLSLEDDCLRCVCQATFVIKHGIPIFFPTFPSKQFDSSRLAAIAKMEREHFWFQGRRDRIQKILKKIPLSASSLLLDIGCGTGYFASCLSQERFNVLGLDMHDEIMRKQPDTAFIQANVENLPLKNEVCDVVFLLDVLEHVDDVKVLQEVKRILRPGGYVILTVPAYQCLWNYRDTRAGHKRRYSRKELSKRLEATGFEIQNMSSYQCLLFPLFALSRILGRYTQEIEENPSHFLNSLLRWITRVESHLSDWINIPFGSTCIATCKKKET